eukprot:861204_1
MLSYETPPGDDRHIQSHEWKITNADKSHSIQSAYPYQFFVSPIFKLHALKWFIKIYPNGIAEKHNKGYVDFEIFMEGLTPNLSEISAKFTISLNQYTPSNDASPHVFSTARISHGELITPSVTTKQLRSLKRIKIMVQIELISSLDIHGNNTIHSESERSLSYPELNTSPKWCRQRSSTSGRVHNNRFEPELAEDYVSKIRAMERTIESLSQRVRTLELRLRLQSDKVSEFKEDAEAHANKSIKNKGKCELKEWLGDTVQLPQHYDVLVRNGFDNLKSVSLVTEDVLSSIGVKLIGHRKLIMFHAINLKIEQKQMVMEQEGVVAQYTNQ